MAADPFSFSAEFVLTAACCIWPHTQRREDAIRAAAEAGIDWDRMQRIVARHRVAGLVHDGLTRTRIAMPPAFAQALGEKAHEIMRDNLNAAAEVVRLQRLLEDSGIEALFFKGPTLAMLAYDGLGLRHAKDIDIAVEPPHHRKAAEILENAGYRRVEPSPRMSEAGLRSFASLRKDFAFVHDKKKLEVELHWRLFDNRLLMPVLPGRARTRPVRIGDATLQTFDDADLFAYLCLHGSLAGWFRLKWLADIGALLARAGSSGLERLYRASVERGAGEAAAQAILLCHRLLGADVPAALLAELNANRNARALERVALWALAPGDEEREPSMLFMGGMRINLSRLRLRSDWRYRWAELWSYTIAPDDLAVLPLPTGLQFLYPILRLPLWLWRRTMRPAH